MKKRLLLVAAVLSLSAGRAHGQDVAQRGRVHGTPLPRAAREQLARDAGAYEFRTALKSELEAVRAARSRLRARGINPQLLAPRQAAAQGVAVQGTYRIPVFAIQYANTAAPPYASSELQRKLFTGPSSTRTLTQLYTEMSRGLVTLTGAVGDWTRASQPDTVYEGVDNGLRAGLLGPLFKEVLDQADRTVDFRQYDGNGDGYVDFVAFVHPEAGGECHPDSRNVWSHRWTYQAATANREPYYQTNDGVRISDYVIQPAYNCGSTSVIDIGVFAHEFGHAFGLPDLYDTNPDGSTNDGIGDWGLMGTGNYRQPWSPTHMEAWSKVELGWMPVVTLNQSAARVLLDPAETVGSAVRIDIPPLAGSTAPSGEYFLLENRQRIGSDEFLPGTGLLVWHVDSVQIANTRRFNQLQVTTSRKGLDLEEADGRAELDRPGDRGDSGDPFPGFLQNRTFGAATRPNSNANRGHTSGVTLSGITETGQQVTFALEIGRGGERIAYWGDVDDDGVLSAADVTALTSESLGRASGAPALSRGDVDANGRIDARDVLIVQSFIAGMEVSRFRVG
ncbi:MAG TPA: M6 family metalloprotease domain-containing protein, partial [Longimicrobiaceae bacterium]